MKINGNAIKPGNIIEHQNAQWRAIKCMAVKPGKGGAFNQVELKNLKTGSKLNERFRANEVVEKLSIDTRPYQYLFSSDEMLTFMDTETFEQIEISISLIGEQKAFLKDGMEVILEIVDGKPIGIDLPEQVVHEVIETESVVKGQTASSSYKPATLDNGLKIMVPPFIESGEKIILDSRRKLDTGNFTKVSKIIADIKKHTGNKLGKSVRLALKHVVGAYAIVVMCKDEPNKLIAARKSSPLVLGIGKENDFYVASDATPIVEYTKQVVYLNDGDIAILNEEKGLKLYNIDEELTDPYVEELELHLEALEKGGYDHFMLNLRQINER